MTSLFASREIELALRKARGALLDVAALASQSEAFQARLHIGGVPLNEAIAEANRVLLSRGQGRPECLCLCGADAIGTNEGRWACWQHMADYPEDGRDTRGSGG